MAKRANPFVDDFIPQSKVHVGDKQLLTNKEQLKKVYEKTLSLLFRGAKKLPPELVLNNNNEIPSHNKKDNFKQLTIGKNGTLQSGGSMMECRLVLEHPTCCGPALVEMRCAYCEVPLCVCCQRMCAGCDRPHCTRCSLAGSDGGEMCVSCYL